MSTTIRDFAELLALLGHLGQNGRRPRMLEATVVRPDPTGGFVITGLNGSDVEIPGVAALSSYAPADLPERVLVGLVQYMATIHGSYQ